ncbi:MAG: metallophosphoesterase [Sedimentisphaerales bacterium]|nr:metallophosphoesterase [Sedimentisphaerales bacterium]
MKRQLAFLTVLMCAGVLLAQTTPTAYVFEYADEWTESLGAAEALVEAGFDVSPLPLEISPANAQVDLIFLGSFASESPAYQDYMAQYASDLHHYVDKGHLLVQMTQADQTEQTPPFLPSTHDARRADQDFARAHVVSPANHLLRGILVFDGLIEFHSRVTVWETFVDQRGFEVVLAGDQYAQYPALMEGACGQGRVILASLALDKLTFGSFGAPNRAFRKIRSVFFENLATHAVAVRNGSTEPLNITPPPHQVSDFVPGSWTLVLLPDTQVYSQRYPGLFLSQTAWIVQNCEKRNIAYVLQLGDITNNNTIDQWEHAQEALAVMDGRVPYAFCPGNHDYGSNGNASTRETYMNQYLPYSRYVDWPTFGGAMEPGLMDNTYHLFEAGGIEWIVVSLEWAPRDETIAWANGVMASYPDREGILITHAYMNNNDLRYDHTDTENPQTYNPHLYNTPGAKNDGQELWDKLVRKHNFAFVFNGHVLGDGTGYLASRNDQGKIVHQMLANYQMRQLGGEAYMRLLEFLPDGRTVQVKTYSPLYDSYLLQLDQQFVIELDP